MTFSFATPGITYAERAGVIPVSATQELYPTFIITGQTSLVGDYGPVTTFATYAEFIAACHADVSAYQRQAVYSAFVHYSPIRVIFIKAHANLQAALDNTTQFLSLLVYPHISTLASGARNTALTALVNWATANCSEVFSEPLVTVDGVTGYVTATPSTVSNILTDVGNITSTSANGHLRYYAPNLPSSESDGTGRWYLSAAAVGAALTAKRVSREGIRQPGAGPKVPVQNVWSEVVPFTDPQATQLAQANVNPIHKVNGVWIIFAAATRATEPAFRSSVARQVFNAIQRAVRIAASQLWFESIDGEGELFQEAHTLFSQTLFELWDEGALFGRTADEAYKVVCDFSNNTAITLESQVLKVDIYAIPSPFAQQVEVTSQRLSIGRLNPQA